MPVSPKVLGQVSPLAATLTDLYTVPAGTSGIMSSVVVTNRSTTATSFRIAIAVAGAPDDVKQYIHYDIPIGGNDTFLWATDIGVGLGPGDVVRVYAALATLSFAAFGAEQT